MPVRTDQPGGGLAGRNSKGRGPPAEDADSSPVRFSMITHRETIETPPELAVVIQMDGQGTLATKYNTWNVLTKGNGGQRFSLGLEELLRRRLPEGDTLPGTGTHSGPGIRLVPANPAHFPPNRTPPQHAHPTLRGTPLHNRPGTYLAVGSYPIRHRSDGARCTHIQPVCTTLPR